MRKSSRILWGIVVVAIGVLLCLKAFNVNIPLFFKGWWTLFIIVPCTIGLLTEREKTDNLIGIIIGVCLLLCCRGILNFALIWKLILPAIIIIVGLKMIFNGMFGNKANEMIIAMKNDGKTPYKTCATFSGYNADFSGQVFEGAELCAVFGGVKCDLRNAVFEKDCAITVSAVFGGIDILVPHTVNVKANVNGVFGGISNKTVSKDENTVTLYINGNCIFGGVDVK